jgi:hypothetical protein
MTQFDSGQTETWQMQTIHGDCQALVCVLRERGGVAGCEEKLV